MSDGERLKRRRVPRHRHLGVGTGGRSATGVSGGNRAAAGMHHRSAAGGQSHSVADTGADGRSRLDAAPDVASGSSLDAGAGVADGIETRTDGVSSGVGTGAAGCEGGGGERVRRPTRHRATPWIVAHRAAAAVGAASLAAVAVITAAVVGGGPPVDTATNGGGEWTIAPASSPLPAVPSARQLSVPLATASPTTSAGTPDPGSQAGGRGGRDRPHPTPKRSGKPRPDPAPKQRPSPGRPTRPITVTADPGSPPSPSLPGRPTSTGSPQH